MTPVTAHTPSQRAPAAPEAARLRELVGGPGGLSPEQFDALLVGFDPARGNVVQFLLGRGVLDRTGAQTLNTVLKGYVHMRGACLRGLFLPASLPPPPAPEAVPAARPLSALDPPAPIPLTRAAPEPPAPIPLTLAAPPRPSLRAQIARLRAELAGLRGHLGTPSHDGQPGDHFAHYTLLRRIGESPHTLVFQARRDHGQHTVALKLPRSDAAPVTLPRFATQARVHARLAHAGLLPLLDAGGRDGAVYLAYADMNTVSIAAYLAQLTGRVQAWTLAQLFVDVGRVLGAAANVGIVHGDLTPANILMCQDDARVRLTDFGMRIPGAPPSPFTAPELAGHGRPTVQADMYSLGVTLKHAATGQADAELRMQHLRPDLPPGLALTIDRLSAHSPRERPASWDEALAAVLAACPRARL